MSLTQKQIQYLKEKAHSLSPVVTIGQKGITESLIKELDSSIENHELLKVKIQEATATQGPPPLRSSPGPPQARPSRL